MTNLSVSSLEIPTNVTNFISIFNTELATIDEKFNENLIAYGGETISELAGYVQNMILTPSDTGVWNGLPLYTSSYVEKDKRFILLLQNKLREYIAFYIKVLTDSGVQRHLVYAKEYENDGNSNNTDRNINSDVPQNSNLYDSQHPESDSLFDQAIADYASSIAKNKAHATSHTEGTSGTTVSGTTWDEAKKNIQMMFYNELKDFIYSLPERIYSLYSLDTIPAPELVKKMIEHYHEVRDMIHE